MEEDKNSFWWGVLSFFIPIAGFILFVIWNNTRKKTASACLIGAILRVILVVCFITFLVVLFFNTEFINLNEKCEIWHEDCYRENNNNYEFYEGKEIKLIIDNREFRVALEDNPTTNDLVDRLKMGDVIIEAHDNGNYEKIGSINYPFVTNDEEMTLEAGDLVLYNENNISLYYDSNTSIVTKLGFILNVDAEDLKYILGSGNVTFVLSLDNSIKDEI